MVTGILLGQLDKMPAEEEVTCDGFASHPGGSRNTPSRFMPQKADLRRLETVSSTFQDVDYYVGHYEHSISVDAKIVVSKISPIIGEHVAVNFVFCVQGYYNNNRELKQRRF